MRTLRGRRSSVPQHRNAVMYGGGLVISLLCVMLLNRISLWGEWPDLPTLYVLFFALFGNPRGRYGPAMMIGFARDLFSGGPLGTYAILYGLMHRFISPRRQMLFRENPITQALVAAVVVFAVNVGYHASMVIVGVGIGWSEAFYRSMKIALISAPLMPALCIVMVLLFEKLKISRLPGGNYNV